MALEKRGAVRDSDYEEDHVGKKKDARVAILELFEGERDDIVDLLVASRMKMQLRKYLDQHKTEEEIHCQSSLFDIKISRLRLRRLAVTKILYHSLCCIFTNIAFASAI